MHWLSCALNWNTYLKDRNEVNNKLTRLRYLRVKSGRKNSKPNIGSHGHAGGTRPDEKRKTPKNLSAHEREERGREESVGLYAVCM